MEKKEDIIMDKIKYTTLSGQEYEVSENFIMHGMSAIWNVQNRAQNPAIKELLDEAHRIMSGVIYGTITKE